MRCGCGRSGTSSSLLCRSRSGSASGRAGGGSGSLGKQVSSRKSQVASLKSQRSSRKSQVSTLSNLNAQLSILTVETCSVMRVEIGAIVDVSEYMADRLPRDFRERAFAFTCKLFDYCEDLARSPGPARQIANQLFDAGSSIGANLEESKAAHSRRELAAKNAISLNESRE